jgi:hypothetical protein
LIGGNIRYANVSGLLVLLFNGYTAKYRLNIAFYGIKKSHHIRSLFLETPRAFYLAAEIQEIAI